MAARYFMSGVSLLVVITACAPQPVPSDKEIRAQVTQRLDGTNDIWAVRNVKKTKGARKEDGTYVADVDYDIVFKMSYPEAVRHVEASSGAVTALQAMQPLLKRYGWWDMCNVVHEQESFPFVNSENGWVIPDDVFRTAQGRFALPEKKNP